jgi:hypothetical protein
MRIAAPDRKNKIVYSNGVNGDIINTIHLSYNRAVDQSRDFAHYFKGATINETAKNIWNFLKQNIIYEKDPEGKQFIRLPRRFYEDKKGDCKSFSLFAAGILGALKLPVNFRYASYDKNNKTPSHIYTTTIDEKGQEIIIDGVYHLFNREAQYTNAINKKMEIAILSGTPENKKISLSDLLHKVRPGGFNFHVIKNQLNKKDGIKAGIRYNSRQIEQYKKALIKHILFLGTKRGAVYQILNRELLDVNSNNFNGLIPITAASAEISGFQEEIGKLSLKKMGKGIKKGLKKISLKNALSAVKMVALAPVRKAILLMVNLNMLGLASRMAKLPPSELANFWKKRGGKVSVLQSAVNRGRRKRAVFKGRNVRHIRGIGFVVSDHYIGEGAAADGAGPKIDFTQIMSIAAPLIKMILDLFKKHNIQEETDESGSSTSDSSTLNALSSLGSESAGAFGDYAGAAIKLAQNTGILPEPPLTRDQSNLNDIIPGNDYETDPVAKKEEESSGSNNTPLFIGAGLLAAVYLYSKNK